MTKYGFLRGLVEAVAKIYIRQDYEELENIHKDEAIIFADNHIN